MQPCACKESRHLWGVSSREKPQFPTNSCQAQDGVTTEALQAQFEHYGRVGPQNRDYIATFCISGLSENIFTESAKHEGFCTALRSKMWISIRTRIWKGPEPCFSLTFTILKNHLDLSPPRLPVIQWTRSLLFCHAFPMPLPYALWTTLAHRLWNLRRRTLELPSWSLHVGMMPERQCRPWWLQRHPHRCLNFLFVAVWKAPPLIQQMNQGRYIMFSQPGLFI